MTAIIRVETRGRSPMFSSEQTRPMSISLPAAPWETPHTTRDTPRPAIGAMREAAERKEQLYAYIAANPGCTYEPAMLACKLTRGQFDGYMRTLYKEGRVVAERGSRHLRNRYFAKPATGQKTGVCE